MCSVHGHGDDTEAARNLQPALSLDRGCPRSDNTNNKCKVPLGESCCTKQEEIRDNNPQSEGIFHLIFTLRPFWLRHGWRDLNALLSRNSFPPLPVQQLSPRFFDDDVLHSDVHLIQTFRDQEDATC